MEGVADDAPSKERIRYACARWRRRCTHVWAHMDVLLRYMLVPTLCISRTHPSCSRRTTRAHTGHLLVLWVWFKRHLVKEARCRVAFLAGMHACVPVCVRVYACVHCMS